MLNLNSLRKLSLVILLFVAANCNEISMNYYMDCEATSNNTQQATFNTSLSEVFSSISTDLKNLSSDDSFNISIMLKSGTVCIFNASNLEIQNQLSTGLLRIAMDSELESSKKSGGKGVIVLTKQVSITLLKAKIQILDIDLVYSSSESSLLLSGKDISFKNVNSSFKSEMKKAEKILKIANCSSLVLDTINLVGKFINSTVFKIQNVTLVTLKSISTLDTKAENANLFDLDGVFTVDLTNLTILNTTFYSDSSAMRLRNNESNYAVLLSDINIINSSFADSFAFNLHSPLSIMSQLDILDSSLKNLLFSNGGFLITSGALTTFTLERFKSWSLNFSKGSLVSFLEGSTVEKQNLYQHTHTDTVAINSKALLQLTGKSVQLTDFHFITSRFNNSTAFIAQENFIQEVTLRQFEVLGAIFKENTTFWAAKTPTRLRIFQSIIGEIVSQGDLFNIASENSNLIINGLSIYASEFQGASFLNITNPQAVKIAQLKISDSFTNATLLSLNRNSTTRSLTNEITLDDITVSDAPELSGIFLELSACPKFMRWSNISSGYNSFGRIRVVCPNTKFVLANQFYPESNLLLKEVRWNIEVLEFVMERLTLDRLIFKNESQPIFQIDTTKSATFQHISINGSEFRNNYGFVQSSAFQPRVYINNLILEAEDPAIASPFKGLRALDIYVSKLKYMQKNASNFVSNFIVSDANSPLGLHIKDSSLQVSSSVNGVIALTGDGARFSLENTHLVFPQNSFIGPLIYIDSGEYLSFSKLSGLNLQNLTVKNLNSKSFITIKRGSLSITNLILINISTRESKVSLLDLDEVTNIAIHNSVIKNILIDRSLFNISGGSLVLADSIISNLTQTKTNGTFLNCQSDGEFRVLRSNFTFLRAGRSGGAIFAKDCAGIITHSTFEGLEAELEGGAITAYLTSQKLAIKNCNFIANKANELAAIAIKTDSDFRPTACYLAENIFDNNGDTYTDELKELTSSKIYLKDNFQYKATCSFSLDGEFKKQFSIDFINNTVSPKILRFQRDDLYLNKSFSGTPCSISIQAEFEALPYHPSPQVNLIVQTSTGKNLSGTKLLLEYQEKLELQLGIQVKAEWLHSLRITIKLSKSHAEEDFIIIIPVINGCLVEDIIKNINGCGCDAGFYLSSIFDKGCKACDEGLICLEEHEFKQREGYYADFDKFKGEKCPVTLNCPEALRDKLFEQNRCRAGTKGKYCGLCEDHWVQSSIFSCIPCEKSVRTSLIITIMVPITIWIALLIVIAGKSHDPNTPSQRFNRIGKYLLLLLSASQYLALMTPLRLSSGVWTDLLLGFFRSISESNKDLSQIYSCQFPERKSQALVAMFVLPYLKSIIALACAFLLRSLGVVKSIWYFLLEYFWLALAMEAFGIISAIVALSVSVHGNTSFFEIQYGYILDNTEIYSEYLVLFSLCFGFLTLLAFILRLISGPINHDLAFFTTGTSGEKIYLNPNVGRLILNLIGLIATGIFLDEKYVVLMVVLLLITHLICLLRIWKSNYNEIKITEAISLFIILIIYLLSIVNQTTSLIQPSAQAILAVLLGIVVLVIVFRLVLKQSQNQTTSSKKRAENPQVELHPSDQIPQTGSRTEVLDHGSTKLERTGLMLGNSSSSSSSD